MTDIIRAGALWGYHQLTQHLGGDSAKFLAEADLSLDAIDNPDAYVSRPAVVDLLELSAEHMQCPDFGMQLAKMQDVNILGALSFAMRNAPNVRQSITTAARYINFQARQGVLSIEPLANRVERIVFRIPPLRQSQRQKVEHTITLFCRIYNHLTGGRARPVHVLFAHEGLLPPVHYAKFFEGVTPQFGADVDAVCMTQEALALPMSGSNRSLQVLVEAYLDSRAPEPHISTTNRTYQALAEIMRFGPANIDDVADMLRMHPRTLQRRLSDQGATFERLRDEIRKDMAERHLSNPLVPLSEVAAVLGYSNQSALARSCARWFGRSPKAMRTYLRSHREGTAPA